MDMRCLIVLLCLIPLAGCGLGPGEGIGVGVAANLVTLTTMHRTVPDLFVSLLTGRDCSMVRLDRNMSYCAHKYVPPNPPPYCTRTLGDPECWADPGKLPDHAPQLSEGPWKLTTAAQIASAEGRWP